jgi:hypothetical protein
LLAFSVIQKSKETKSYHNFALLDYRGLQGASVSLSSPRTMTKKNGCLFEPKSWELLGLTPSVSTAFLFYLQARMCHHYISPVQPGLASSLRPIVTRSVVMLVLSPRTKPFWVRFINSLIKSAGPVRFIRPPPTLALVLGFYSRRLCRKFNTSKHILHMKIN